MAKLNYKRVASLLIAITMCHVSIAWSMIMGRVPIDHLNNDAPIVCIASATHVQIFKDEQNVRYYHHATLKIHYIFKGNAESGQILYTEGGEVGETIQSPPIDKPSGPFLLFLKEKDGHLEPRYAQSYAINVDTDILEQIKSGKKDLTLEDIVLKNLKSSNEFDVVDAIGDIVGLRGKGSIPHIKALLGTDVTRVKGKAILSLINQGQAGYFKEALRFCEQTEEDSVEEDICTEIINEINRTAGTKALNTLLAFANNDDKYIRNEAYMALADKKDTRAIKLFIRCLNEAEDTMMHRVDIGLCVDGLHNNTKLKNMPNSKEYAKNSSSVKQVWLEWWENEGKKKYGK